MLGDLNQDQIEHLLRSQSIGRIGCHANEETYVVPITYVYADGYIYGHTGKGQKVEMMRLNPYVCFEVDAVRTMTDWQSVIAWGVYEELQGEAAEKAMHLLVSRIIPLTGSVTALPSHTQAGMSRYHAGMSNGHTVVYRIRITRKTGRYEKRD